MTLQFMSLQELIGQHSIIYEAPCLMFGNLSAITALQRLYRNIYLMNKEANTGHQRRCQLAAQRQPTAIPNACASIKE